MYWLSKLKCSLIPRLFDYGYYSRNIILTIILNVFSINSATKDDIKLLLIPVFQYRLFVFWLDNNIFAWNLISYIN